MHNNLLPRTGRAGQAEGNVAHRAWSASCIDTYPVPSPSTPVTMHINASWPVTVSTVGQTDRCHISSLQSAYINSLMHIYHGESSPLAGGRLHGRDCPPPVNATPSVPLPALSTEPILVHPILAYHAPSPVVRYELNTPPSSASLAPLLRESVSRRQWSNQPAMSPATIGSMTIRIAGMDRPVVVFPARLETGVVTVGDVLRGVHEAISAAAQRDEMGANLATWTGLRGETAPWAHGCQHHMDTHGPVSESGSSTSSSNRAFHTEVWWGGLCPSATERDVWVLVVNRVQSRRYLR